MAERKKAKGIWTAQSPDEDARQLNEVRVVDENGFNPSERPIGEAETEDPGVIDNRPTTPRQPAMKRVYADMPEVQVSAQNPSGVPAMPDATAQEPNAYQKMMIDHGNELADYEKAYDGQIKSVGDFISAAEAKIKERKEQDGQYRKRENAYRYISGLGDTLSGIANLVGTANDASNQEQKYNSHAVVQKAEEARKARKLEMDKISERIDEMKERERALRASKDLKTAELRARQAKEARELQFRQDQLAREQEREDARMEENRRQFDERMAQEAERSRVQQDQWQKTYNMQYAKFKEEQKGNQYNFTFSDGSIDIPKNKINEGNIERIYKMLPEDVRNAIKGEAYTEYETDEFGQSVRKTGNKAPSLAQKLAAIGAYAENDSSIKNELRRLAGMKVVTAKENPKTDDKGAGTPSSPYIRNTGLWYDQWKDGRTPGIGVNANPFDEFK